MDRLHGRGPAPRQGVVTAGDHAAPGDLPPRARRDPLAFSPRGLLALPPGIPGGLLRPLTVSAFNEAWFRKSPRQRRGEAQPLAKFFHPLDGVAAWNRVYGPRGFVQWQMVVPENATELVRHAVRAFADASAPAFLAVLKRFGPAGRGHLSFPTRG